MGVKKRIFFSRFFRLNRFLSHPGIILSLSSHTYFTILGCQQDSKNGLTRIYRIGRIRNFKLRTGTGSHLRLYYELLIREVIPGRGKLSLVQPGATVLRNGDIIDLEAKGNENKM